MKTKEQSVLVTGGTGFLGSHLCLTLHKRGYKVLSLSRGLNPDLQEAGVEQIQMDLSAPNSQLHEVLKKVEAVFHTAGKVAMWGHWDDFYRVNVLGTLNLVDAAKKQGVRHFIYTSTPSVVFNNNDITGGDEGLAYAKNSKSLYARSKIPAEKYVLKNNSQDFKTLALRPHLIFGPGDQNLIPRLVEKSKRGKLKVIGDAQNQVDVIHIDNAVQAHIKAFNALKNDPSKVEGEAFFIAQERPVYLWNFINEVLARYQRPKVRGRIPYPLAYGLASVIEGIYKALKITKSTPPSTRFVVMQLAKSHYFSHKKAREKLGYRPSLTLEDAIKTLGVQGTTRD